MKELNVAIIIVTYNSEDVISNCLRSLKFIDCNYDVFISDNDSKDNTVSISLNFGANVLQNHDNVGYSRAINSAFNNFVTSKYTHILILNPDVYFTNPVSLIGALKTCNTHDVVTIEMKDSKGNHRVNTFKFPSIFNICLNRHRLDHREPKKTSIVQTVEGSFMLMSRDLFELLNGFDQKIFLYGEDYEFCYRVKLAGGQVIYNPISYYIHDGGFNSSRKRLVLNGLIYFFKKHKSTLYYFYVYLFINFKSLFIR
ncbi:MAG: N-acetylglucosaminyl-diphospho-decaprenol L-rhamnosyltransferase [Cocleimonas sp.]|jgi:N-acetylglucosaminyl-diphospho-decaprenol L-rhamnosyltransferase